MFDIYLAVLEDDRSIAPFASDFVLTPKGTVVPVISRTETHSSSVHLKLDYQKMVDVYNVELVEPGSCLYNCHYYA